MLFRYLDIIFFCIVSLFVGYDLFFVITSFLPSKKKRKNINKELHYAVLFPAYKEDKVIIDSVTHFLKQNYPKDKYDVIVISDKMKEETNLALSKLPIRLFVVNFKISLKSKAITYALEKLNGYDKVIIMDADNITDKNFLTEVNQVCQASIAIQLHRTHKNSDTPIAVWDGIAEEINNTIYRKGHANIGLSASLIGSGMVFNFDWLKENMKKCSTFAEDRELEVLLAQKNIFVDYANSIYVYDEKISQTDTFLKQRARWAHAQSIAFTLIFRCLKSGKLNKNCIDKAFQWLPFPKQFRVITLTFAAVIISFASIHVALKWWCLLILQIAAMSLAIPKNMYNSELWANISRVPFLLFISVKSYIASFFRIKNKDMSFGSTPHETTIKNE